MQPTPARPPIDSPETARAGAHAFFRLAERWAVTRAEQGTLLGLRLTSTLDNWRRRPPASLPPDTMERISYLLDIYRSLRQIFEADRADEWIRRAHSDPRFMGRSAVDYMLRGQVRHLLDVHRYLQVPASGVF